MSNSMYDVRNEADKIQKGLKPCPYCESTRIKISCKFWTKFNIGVNRAKVQCYCTKCHAMGPRKVIMLDLDWKPLKGEHVFDEVREAWGLENESR